MEQLTKSGLSSENAAAPRDRTSIAGTEKISEEELQALLAEARTDLLHRPVPRLLEVYARIAARVLIDIIAVLGAIWFVYWLRFENAFIVSTFAPESVPAFNDIAFPLIAWSPFLLLSLKFCGLYDTHTRLRTLDRIPRIVGSVNAYIISFLLVSFLLKTPVFNRGFIVFFWLFTTLFLFAGRILLQSLLYIGNISETVMRKTLIVGSGKVGKEVARKLKRHEGFGLIPIGFLDDDPLYTEFDNPELKDLKVLGKLEDLCRVVKDFKVEKVIIAFNGSSAEQLLDLASKCNSLGVECSIVPRLFEVITNEIQVNEIGGIPLMRIREKKIEGINKVLKAAEDYLLGMFILLLCLPIIAITAILIKLDSPGPVFFLHKRIGKNGKCFKCIKFRSMCKDAEFMQAEMVNNDNSENGWLCWKKGDDPRITRVGKWIRKLSIDELPQIFNVLAGQMSLVGPRPHIKEEAESYKQWHKQRLNVKPGITGLWQVSGRSELPFDEMIKMDLYYIETWSLWLDFKIIVRTFIAVLRCKGAC